MPKHVGEQAGFTSESSGLINSNGRGSFRIDTGSAARFAALLPVCSRAVFMDDRT